MPSIEGTTRRFPHRTVVLGAIGLSVAAHGAALVALGVYSPRRDRGTLIDTEGVPTELLTIAPREARIQPPPPEPEPQKIEEPVVTPPPASEPAPATVRSELARPEPIAAPAPEPVAPPPAPVATAPAPAPMASFAGVQGTRAARVVYVLDGSGPMTSCLPFVKRELEHSVSRLEKGQAFQVIVTRRRASADGAEVRIFRSESGGFASPEQSVRVALRDWLGDVEPRWASDPMAGLEAAVREGPDLVFLLTRSIRRSASGDVAASADAALARLDALNPADGSGRRRVVIKIIQFLDEDPTGLLRRIAERHGDGAGSYRVMRLEEVRE